MEVREKKSKVVVLCSRFTENGEIRHFYVVVVQWRKKEIQKGDARAKCFFFLLIYTQCLFAILSWRRRLRCPVLPLKVSFAVMRELKKYR